MSTATYDGRSLMLDGRRIWIVSGTLPFACIPAESWADRLHAAKLAGLNTVEVPVPWLACEPRPGVFTFEGQSDINRFLTLAAEAGLRVILRPGPYVGGTMDLGGLPSWLLDNPEIICRGKSPEFLEAVSRFITALAAQVSPLLATAPTPGPVILLQSEHRWTCGDDDLAAAYLGELARYQRESGLGVPVLNANNMWQGLEGQIDAWVGGEGLFAIVRQLGAVRPDQPRIVIGLETGEDTALFEADPAPIEPMEAQRRVAEALASAGQPNLSHAFGSTAFGFLSGSSATGDSRPLASTQQSGSIIDAAGAPTELFGPARRILSFASAFGRLFSHLEPEFRPVVIDPNAEDEERGTPVSVAYASGGQGSVAFVFTDQPGKGRKAPGPVTLLRPEGAAVSVPLGEQRVYWCLFEVLLSGRTMLDYCTLCALTFDETFLVLFGPPGETGELSINGSPLDVTVPKGRKPLVERHEGVTVVVVSEEVVDQTFVTQEGVYVGVASVTADGEPIGSGKAATHVSRDAQVAGASASKPPPAGKATLGQWEAAGCDAYLDGSSPRFASIDGPADMSALGTPHGYGWYRLSLRMGATKRGKVAAPGSGDRLGVYVDAEHAGIIVVGARALADDAGVLGVDV
ncbi:MAG: beta-galactosidase, partial [Planctomycetota bacterium]